MLAEHTRLNPERSWYRTASTLQDVQLSHVFPLHNDKQRHSSSPQGQQSAKPELSGLDPQAHKEDGGARRDRTDDLKLAKLPLSQLSYGPKLDAQSSRAMMVGLGGFEPPTSRLSSARSNQLSYRPKAAPARATPARRPTPHAPKTLSDLALNARRSRPHTAKIIQRIRPEIERETKTASFRKTGPDLVPMFQADMMIESKPPPKYPTLERR